MDTLPTGFLEVDLESFFEKLLPSVSNDKVLAIVTLLHRNVKTGAFGSHKQRDPASIVKERWRWYPKDPMDMPGAEDTVFAHFNDIYAVITAAARIVLGLELAAATQTSLQASHSKASKKQQRGLYPFDSIASWNFRKSDDESAVHQQFLEDVENLMFKDPARRFRFGITITNTSTRLWFLSRAQCFVSKPFNFITDHHPLVHFFASITLASHEELGYDLTVRRVLVKQPAPPSDLCAEDSSDTSEKVAYEYLVQDGASEIWYRTVDTVLFQYQKGRRSGRAIRVWKVRRVARDEKGEHILEGPVMVLKDYWMTKSWRTEGEIQHDILTRAKAARSLRGEPPQSVDDVKKHFMTIVHDVPVLLENGEEDNSEEFIRPLASRASDAGVRISVHRHTAEGSVDEIGTATKLMIGARRHRRLVFVEVGVPLHNLKDHRLLFQCLADATKGLKVFHDAEYVHRDISTGNLLFCNTEGGPVCKISDLEHARPQAITIKEEWGDSQRTGTPFYMSTEIQDGTFTYRLPRPYQHIEIPPFLHNYLHDIEGLWWIAMWSLFHTIPAAQIYDVERNVKKRLNQEMIARAIFPKSSRGSAERRRFLNDKVYFDKASKNVPAEFKGVIRSMQQAAHLLVIQTYVVVQDDPTIQQVNTPEPYTSIYGPMQQCFLDAILHAAQDVRLISEVRAKAEEKEAKEKRRPALTLRAYKADDMSVGKKTAGNAAADLPTSRPSKRAKDDAPPVPVEGQDIAGEPPSPIVVVQQRAGFTGKKVGRRSSTGNVSLRERVSERIKTMLGRTKPE